MADTTLPETTTSNPSDPAASQPDKSFYTWSTWFSILSGQATPADRDRYLNARDTIKEAADCARCAKHRDYLLQYSPVVRFLREQINELGQDINSDNVRCKRCTTRQSGGFDSEYGILLCANQLRNRGHVEDTMAHEMVHAWDHLRFKVERGNLRHAACTEVRAANSRSWACC